MARMIWTLAALTFTVPALALAQTPSASPLMGPPVPGVCVLSREAVIANAKVGVAASARLKTFTDQAQGEIDQARTPIANDLKALEAQKASLTPAQLQPRQDALSARLTDLQRQAEAKSRRIQVTRDKALAQISTALQPVVAQAYQAHRCGILFNRDMMLGGNPAADLTADVVKGLDARITTISFDLEPAPTPATSKP